jgi:hypothetical protein
MNNYPPPPQQLTLPMKQQRLDFPAMKREPPIMAELADVNNWAQRTLID